LHDVDIRTIRSSLVATPPRGTARIMNRISFWLIAVAVLAIACWLFPPVAIRSRTEVELARAGALFSPRDFVDKFWNEHLAKSFDHAADAAAVLAAMADEPQQLRKKFGHTVGISSSYCLYLRGTGRVVSVTADQVGLAVASSKDVADVVVPLGFVFGNAVRDGTGLLSSSTFPNAQQFNAIAAGLNQIVETAVLPELQRLAAVGQRVKFVGCVEVADEERDLRPLKLVPVSVQLE